MSVISQEHFEKLFQYFVPLHGYNLETTKKAEIALGIYLLHILTSHLPVLTWYLTFINRGKSNLLIFLQLIVLKDIIAN